MTPDLDAIRRRCEAATSEKTWAKGDAALRLADSAADVPALVAEVERLRAALDAVAKAAQRVDDALLAMQVETERKQGYAWPAYGDVLREYHEAWRAMHVALAPFAGGAP